MTSRSFCLKATSFCLKATFVATLQVHTLLMLISDGGQELVHAAVVIVGLTSLLVLLEIKDSPAKGPQQEKTP